MSIEPGVFWQCLDAILLSTRRFSGFDAFPKA